MALTKEELNKRIEALEKISSSLHEIRGNLSKEAIDLNVLSIENRNNKENVDFGIVSNNLSASSLDKLDPITRFAMQ